MNGFPSKFEFLNFRKLFVSHIKFESNPNLSQCCFLNAFYGNYLKHFDAILSNWCEIPYFRLFFQCHNVMTTIVGN